MPSQRRRARLHKLIKRMIGELLQEELGEEGILISVTGVDTSSDLQWVDISLSIFPYERHKEMMDLLRRKVGMFQSIFNRQLPIRHTPKLRFQLDSRLEAGVIDEGM